MRRRIIVGIVMLILLWVITVPAIYDADQLLSGNMAFRISPMTTLRPVLEKDITRKLLLLVMGIDVLAVVACLISGSQHSTRTGVQKITPDITIPAAAGQGQFGTARFLTASKYKKAFTECWLPAGNSGYKYLMEKGVRDSVEIEEGREAVRERDEIRNGDD